MKIVHNFENINGANLFFWPQKLCNPDDIVINVDADDKILGAQALKIVNHLYKN